MNEGNSRLTATLKAELWRRFGNLTFPAEWDGQIHGGGKLSQRFWEYFKAIELLDLDQNSIVLDIGGGFPATGLGFFSSVLATQAKKLIILDPCLENAKTENSRVELIPINANYQELQRIFKDHPNITHVSSISVFEHIHPEIREEITRAIDDHFLGESVVMTFEFHGSHEFWQHQLTTRSASRLVGELKAFYLDRFEASPVWCENAFDRDPKFRVRDRRFVWQRPRVSPSYVPLWYPVALRFLRSSSIR